MFRVLREANHDNRNTLLVFSFFSGLWLDYIRLELQHPCGKPDTAGELYWRATKSLDGEFTEEFVGLYSLLRADRL